MSHCSRSMLVVCLASLLAAAASADGTSGPTKLLRFPDLHGDEVVFTYAGDLWLASVAASGGSPSIARRLTSHPGLELFAKFSPDGRWLAFTGQYDGDEQVYVVPTEGGVPRQLTFYPADGPLPPRWGYDNQVYGWTPDGKAVLLRSMRDGSDLADTRLYTVSVDGGLPVPLPMPVSGAGDLSPDGKRAVYSPLMRDFRHWKRYQGGWAQDLYIFDLATHETVSITDHPRADRDPMWIGDKVYFASDRDGTLNLYSYDPASQATAQLTHSELWDVRWPSSDPSGQIVYELNGELQILRLESGRSRAIPIRVPDDGVASRPSRLAVEDWIEDSGLAPQGKRALFTARGDIFTVPIEHGPVRNLTRSSGAHDREPAWSSDGRQIAYVSDASGEEEIYLIDQDGHGEPRQLTTGSGFRYFDLQWSPSDEHLAFRDQNAKLYVLTIATKERIEVADDVANFGMVYDWSPHGGHLAFSLADVNVQRSLYIWSLEDRQTRRVTGELWNEDSPAWGSQGNYLYFVSDREFAPQMDLVEWNFANNRRTQIYALALRRDVAHPFPPRSDEVAAEADADASSDDAEAKGDRASKKGKKASSDDPEEETEKKEPIAIDFEGLGERVARVPVDAGNYFGLSATEGHLLYARGGAFYYGRQSHLPVNLFVFKLEDRKETQLASEVLNAEVSPDGSKALIQLASGFELRDISSKGKDKKKGKPVSTAGLAVDRVPAEEWAQIFDEVWRRFRDFFYVENLHGYDWKALGEQYRPLLAHVGHRSDLNYVLSEMIAELNVSHAYVSGGDYEVPDRPHAALLGARFELDPAASRYRIKKIFAGHNLEDRYRSPLTEIGVDVEVGDYLLAINGVDLVGSDNPYRLLRHAGDSPVELTVHDKPSKTGARRVIVDPIASEDSLLYLGWVEANRRWVDEASGGKLGYLHIPDMGSAGLREFIKWYYGQVRKSGLVIDVRSNGGGNISQMLIERLGRELLMVDFERHVDYPETYPNITFHGHLVCLLDEDTASDGDQFAYVFQQAGLGPLIGKRSWGGVVGIYGRGPLIDGGGVSVPESGSANADGRWVIEGHGVDPDIVVENDPKSVLEGRDPQLEKAVEVLLEKIESDPKRLPEQPSAPIKTK